MQSSSKCKAHNMDCAAINLDPQCEPDNRILCVQCLTKPNKGVKISIKDAENEFSAKQQQYKQQMEEQAKQNISILTDLSSNLDEFQKVILSSIEKLQSIIRQQIQVIQNQQQTINETLITQNVFQFYSSAFQEIKQESIYSEIRKLLETQLQSMNWKEQFEQCSKLLKDIDESQVCLQQDDSLHYIQRQLAHEHDTPHLNLICQEHNKEIILFDITTSEKSKENRIACVTCISGQAIPYTELLKVQQLWQEYEQCQKDLFDKSERIFQEKKQITLQSFRNMREKINLQINKLEGELIKKEFNVDEVKSQINHDWYFLQREQVLQIADTLSKPQRKDNLRKEINFTQREIEKDIYKLTENSIFYIKESVEQCIQNLNQQNEEQIDPQFSLNINRSNFKKQKIQQIPQIQVQKEQIICTIVKQKQSYFDDNDRCFAITFNSKQTIMAAAFWSTIKLFDFQYGQFSFTDSIKCQIQGIKSLLFNKKSNKLIISGADKCIQILTLRLRNGKQRWCSSQTLSDHTDFINQVIINKSEDFIISCSKDCSIKFWTFEDDSECYQTLKAHQDEVLCISLNESGTRLVSCSDDKKIIIFQNQDNYWSVEQVIKGWGYRLCFIEDNILVFQPVNGKKMKIYKYKDDISMFQNWKNLSVRKGKKCRMYFPMIFNQQNQILINKNGRIINVIRVNNNQEFLFEQQIEFTIGSGYIFGALTKDGEYLATFDFQSQKLEVRKLQIY